MARVWRYPVWGGVVALSFLVSACGHYKSDFSCKGYPESAQCLSTEQVYKRRHEQLTKMKEEEKDDASSSSRGGEAAADRVSGVAGLAEVHLGQPNITAPKVMQVWIAPWRDRHNFLHEASIVYAIVQQSDWTYGRAPKGTVRGGMGANVFAPRMAPGMVEQAYSGNQRPSNGAQPVFASPPVSPVPPVQPTVPARPGMSSGGVSPQLNGSQDPSVILRQLQQQVPSLGTPGGVPPGGASSGDPDVSFDEQQERLQEQRERMYQ